MLRKAETLEDFDRDLRAFNCMDRIPEIKVGKYFYSDIRFNKIGSDVVAFYSGALNREVEKLEKENQQLKAQIEKLKQEKANCIKMLKDWENLVCVGLSEGCCPSCDVCLFGELKEQTEKIKGIERL